MSLISYRNEARYLAAYCQLIQRLYSAYPGVAEAKQQEAKRAFSSRNPFRKHGTYQNFLLMVRNRAVAHASACIDPRLPEGVGLVGYFESLNRNEYAHDVLEASRLYLAKHRVNVIRGPINFNTWHSFRISYPEANSPYVFEPFTRSYYKRLFENFGFHSVYRAVSAIQDVEKTNFGDYRISFLKLQDAGFTFRSVDKSTLRSALEDIHRLSNDIFQNTWTFSRITLEEFLYQFSDVSELKACPLIVAAYHQSSGAIGFIIGAQDTYSRRVNRVVLKTLAVHPEYQGRGIGRALLYLAYQTAVANKAAQFIFSTIRTDNSAVFKLITDDNPVYRRYEAYEISA